MDSKRSKTSADVIDRALHFISLVSSQLDSDEQLLWLSFLEHDANMNGVLQEAEVRKMLQSFAPTSSASECDAYYQNIKGSLDQDPSSAMILTFIDLLMWWKEEQDAETISGVALKSFLSAKFVAIKAKSLTWDLLSKTVLELRIENAGDTAALNAVKIYLKISLQISHWKNELIQTAHVEEMKERILRAKDEVILDRNQQFQLESVFSFVTDGKCEDSLMPLSKLASAAFLLGADLSYSEMLVTEKLFTDPMDIEAFKCWWVSYPKSKLLKNKFIFF